MSKLLSKYLQDYSLSTLRDVLFTALAGGDFIVYDSDNSRFINQKQPRFGTDFSELTTVDNGGFPITGNQFQTFGSLDFDVTGPDTLNKFRIACSFVWRHDSAANDGRFRLVLDGNEIGSELRIEPKDTGNDQRNQNIILNYPSNLSIGSHTIEFQARPANNSRVTTLHESVIEVWRVN